MLNAYIYDGLRTPFGRHAGALATVRPDDLVAQVMQAVVARNPWPAADIEDVILGCTRPEKTPVTSRATHCWPQACR
jgi:acetyl-CoA C-acetyltransferase